MGSQADSATEAFTQGAGPERQSLGWECGFAWWKPEAGRRDAGAERSLSPWDKIEVLFLEHWVWDAPGDPGKASGSPALLEIPYCDLMTLDKERTSYKTTTVGEVVPGFIPSMRFHPLVRDYPLMAENHVLFGGLCWGLKPGRQPLR